MKAKLLIILLLAFFCAQTAHAAGARAVRVAYVENGPYWFFTYTYAAFQRFMARLPHVAVIYPADMHFSPGWLKPQEDLDKAARQLMADNRVDLIIGAGTAAVRALQKANNGKTPFIGIGVADPVGAGIVPNADDSGLDNFTCETSPDRLGLMLRVFHEVASFKKLGLLYPEGPEGRFYSGLKEAAAAGKAAGFELIARKIPDESVNSCLDGLLRLVESGVEAVYVTPLMCFDWEAAAGSPGMLFSKLNGEYGLPTLADAPSVRGGALMGYSLWDMDVSGKAIADAAWRIINGERPRDVKLSVPAAARLAINVQTALEVGVDLPFDVLLAADQIYETTREPDMKKFMGGIK